MAKTSSSSTTSQSGSREPKISRSELINLLNKDLAREYQAIIAYVVYSQVLKGAAYINIAAELEKHAQEELNHALIIAKQIDYLGGMPAVKSLDVALPKRQPICCATISSRRMKPFATIGSVFASAKLSASLPWPNIFVTF